MPIETYDQALEFWFARVNYEQRGMPRDLSELKLDRMRALLGHLGDPQQRLRIVHITGSKGKGSTAAMLAAIGRAAGYHTGLFISPHLVHVEERCQVDGQPIPPEELTALMREVAWAVEQVEARHASAPTFFEIVTALGFLHFVRRRVELAIVEVGLGGRFDSTNVCQPLLAILTSISFDHTAQLGNTLASIASEKAGIIKPGRPVISGVVQPEARAVIVAAARVRGAKLIELDQDFTVSHQPARFTSTRQAFPQIDVHTRRGEWPPLTLSLLGEHQAANAAVAIAAVEELRCQGLRIDNEAVRAGLLQTRWPARIEVLGRSPWVILDCAHNAASAAALVETLAASFPPARRTLIFACSRDKDAAAILRILAPHFARACFTKYLGSQRGYPVAELAEEWKAVGGGSSKCYATPATAWEAAVAQAESEDMICITGSVFLAGELRPLLVETLRA